MRVIELRLLLALILVLLGATVSFGLNLGDDAADRMTLQDPTQRLRGNPEEKILTPVRLTSSARPPSRTDSAIARRSSTSVIDLVRALRC